MSYIIIPLFFILGCILISGKGEFLVAGFNTLPESGKAKYNRKAICQATGIVMFITCLWIAALEFSSFSLILINVLYALILIAYFALINLHPFFKA